ncbi:MAG: flagellar protein FliT [Legionella sp.]|nr:flagellar protein FliT [Legionella sp.]
MTGDEIIQTYEAILAVTREMLEAAHQGNWELLAAREHACRELVEKLMSVRADGQLGPEARRRKVEIIRKVLADDAEIRNLTEPWLARLQHLLTSTGQERKLYSAYGPPG